MKQYDEALLNEYKGNLFEYLVGLELSKSLKQEFHFMENISDDFFRMFKIQEQYIRNNIPELINKLQVLSFETSNKIISGLNTNDIKLVNLIGKIAANNNGEGDLKLTLNDGSHKFISLKLNKTHSFVNTKSGGVKSFLSKYFKLEDIEQLQGEFNVFFEKEYVEMAIKMNLSMDLDASTDFKNWCENSLPELPGELAQEQKEILHGFYSIIMTKLYETFQSISVDIEIFKDGLFAILGNTNRDTTQVLCFHQDHELKEIKIYDLKSIDNIEMGELNSTSTNFEISVDSLRLQIRLKPMNKFTNTAYKINCSVKY